MKRSQMIQDILDYTCGSYMLDERIVNEILEIIEKAGMLPPDISMCNCEDCGGPAHVWEQE